MSRAEDSLQALDGAALTELTNAGTVRRALKELDQVEVAWSRDGATWVATSSDDTVQQIGAGHFDTWSCTCPAEHRCRHIVRAVLLWQRRADAGPPSPSGQTSPEESFFTARTLAEADRTADRGVLAQVTRHPRLLVRLLHPVHLSVRYPVGTEARYARCECGAAACVHLALAERLVAALSPTLDAGLVALGAPTTLPSAETVAAAHRAWRAWLGQLLEAGLAAVDHLLGSVVRLASVWEVERLSHPGEALRELAEQLEHHRRHDAQLSPEQILLLLGEVEARLRALSLPDSPAPHPVVAGSKPTLVRAERSRLMGLGAEYRHVGGWNQLRVHLLDLQTGAVSSLHAEADDTEARQVHPSDLLARRTNGVPLADWAASVAVVPRLRRTGAQLSIGTGRVTVAPGSGFDADALAAVAPRTLSEVAAVLPDLPDLLGPRNSTDALMVLPVAEVHEVEIHPARSRVRATLLDTLGAPAEIVLPWGARTEVGARLLADTLVDPERSVVAVAGRWRRGHTGLQVVPTAVWTDSGVLLPQVDAAPGGRTSTSAQASHSDPWRASWEQVAELLSALVVLGARRGAERLGRDLAVLAQTLQGRGLSRAGDLVGELAAGVHDPGRRVEAVAALCVRLAFLD